MLRLLANGILVNKARRHSRPAGLVAAGDVEKDDAPDEGKDT
jgi:hypothetical protein